MAPKEEKDRSGPGRAGRAATWWQDEHRQAARTRFRRGVVAAIPVAAVNATAFVGQFAFIRSHVPWILPGQILVAATLESVAVYLAWHAHIAQMANDSAFRLKIGAYSFALVMGSMNYSHYAVHWRPTFMAVGMLLMSSLSPWLWGVHTRRASRDELMARGLIEEHSVRLGVTRWAWHPLRAVRVMSWAAWHGVSEPKRAIGHFEPRWGSADTPLALRQPRAKVPAPAPVPVIAPAPVPAAGVPAAPVVPAAAEPVVPAEPDLVVPDAVAGWHATDDGTPLLVRPEHVPADAVPVFGHDGEVTAYTVPAPGTEPGPVPVPGPGPEAHLSASATMPSGRPAQADIDAADLRLAGMSLEEARATSEREIARWLGGPRHRRLAKDLKASRLAAGTSLAEAPPELPPASRNGSHRQPGMIASPVQFQPGGNQAND